MVVPVYQVEPYLGTCLDSILKQSFRDIELIIVDDCSPDRCGEIADEYAVLDPRVRPVHLDHNGGLDNARNVGFGHARGDYVWFVDSDDWLTDGTLEAVAQRLNQCRPDVLMVDYVRDYVGGRTRRNVNAHLLRHAPESFRIGEYPQLLRNFGVAWNKVVRSAFLRESGVEFPDGWYEDVPFTYPLLAKADRISVLDRVCLHYRQRRHGNIVTTTSPRHAEVFAQYEDAMAKVDDPDIRDFVIQKGIDHAWLILRTKGRLPGGGHRAFFDQLVDFGTRHGAFGSGVRDLLLKNRAFGWYQLMRAGRDAAKGARNRLRQEIPRLSWRSVSRKLTLAPALAYYWAQRRLPLRDLAIYGSYWGRAYECSPAAIHAAAARLAPHVRGVWAVTKDQAGRMPPGVEHVVIGSLAYYRALARAKWAINNVNFDGEIVKRPGSVHVQTHHGTPLKLMGVDEPAYRSDPEKLLTRCDRWDFSLVSNTYSARIWGRAYPCRFETLEYGYPRNDALLNTPPAEVARMRSSYPDGLLVLFAPTFRSSAPIRAPSIPGATVLDKQHYFVGGESPPITELMLVSDVLVTDYSSVMFDYALLDRPIVIYAPDWDEYRRERGVYFDLLAHPPGVVARTESELREAFESGAVWDSDAARKAFREQFCQFDDGRAAERVVRRVILGDTSC